MLLHVPFVHMTMVADLRIGFCGVIFSESRVALLSFELRDATIFAMLFGQETGYTVFTGASSFLQAARSAINKAMLVCLFQTDHRFRLNLIHIILTD